MVELPPGGAGSHRVSPVPGPPAAAWPVAPSGTTDRHHELTVDDGLTSCPPPPLPDTAWVLNAMHAHESASCAVSHDEYHIPSSPPGRSHPRPTRLQPAVGEDDGKAMTKRAIRSAALGRLRPTPPARRFGTEGGH